MNFIKDFVSSNMFKYVVGAILIAIAYLSHLINGDEALTYVKHLLGM